MSRLLLVLITGVLITPTQAAASLYCGNDLISRGDHLVEVLKHCGEPTYREEYVIRRPVSYRFHEYSPQYTEIRPISVKEWTYNFGRHKFMRQIRFEDGVVQRIDTLGKGFID